MKFEKVDCVKEIERIGDYKSIYKSIVMEFVNCGIDAAVITDLGDKEPKTAVNSFYVVAKRNFNGIVDVKLRNNEIYLVRVDRKGMK